MAEHLLKIPDALNYQGDTKQWIKFKQQFDVYMKASGLDKNGSENKVNIFLNIGGDQAIEIFENLNLTSEQKKNYDIVMEAFNSYCKSKHNEIYKSFKFFTRVQQPSEFFSEFYNDLLVMASFCNFGDQKDRLIRDKIIAGIRNPELQEQFLKSPDLTLEEVVKVCLENDGEKINNKNVKNENLIYEERNTEGESNNNYSELPNIDTNVINLNTLDQINLPNDLLFDGIESEADFADNMDLMELSSEINDLDYKPMEISSTNQRTECKSRNMPSSNDPISKTSSKIFHKKTIEAIAERKSQKRNTSKCNRSNNRMQLTTTDKKPPRTKKRKSKLIMKSEFKTEPSEECDDDLLDSYIPIEDQDEYSEIACEEPEMFSILNENADITNMCVEDGQLTNDDSFLIEYENQIEDRDEYTQTESANTAIFFDEDKEVLRECDGDSEAVNEEFILIEYEKELEDQDEYSQISYEGSEISLCTGDQEKKKEIVNESEHSDLNDADLGMMNEMAEAEYLLEKDTKVSRRRKKKRKSRAEPKLVKVKRDNLPPLILKSIRKKTLLLGKMPFSCKKCDATFWTSMQLDKHQLVHVLKKPAPPSKPPSKVFKCEECGKEFRKISDLERHIRVHTGEKPSVCNICNKRFQQPYNLNKHLYTHTQEKNFECVICQKKFGRNDVLNRHVLTHSIVKPFKCSVCSKTFIRNTQLKLHLQKHHNLNEDPVNGNNDSAAGTSSSSD